MPVSIAPTAAVIAAASVAIGNSTNSAVNSAVETGEAVYIASDGEAIFFFLVIGVSALYLLRVLFNYFTGRR